MLKGGLVYHGNIEECTKEQLLEIIDCLEDEHEKKIEKLDQQITILVMKEK